MHLSAIFLWAETVEAGMATNRDALKSSAHALSEDGLSLHRSVFSRAELT
jgi:hypothetical protein